MKIPKFPTSPLNVGQVDSGQVDSPTAGTDTAGYIIPPVQPLHWGWLELRAGLQTPPDMLLKLFLYLPKRFCKTALFESNPMVSCVVLLCTKRAPPDVVLLQAATAVRL